MSVGWAVFTTLDVEDLITRIQYLPQTYPNAFGCWGTNKYIRDPEGADPDRHAGYILKDPIGASDGDIWELGKYHDFEPVSYFYAQLNTNSEYVHSLAFIALIQSLFEPGEALLLANYEVPAEPVPDDFVMPEAYRPKKT